jgi:hypothetical protein
VTEAYNWQNLIHSLKKSRRSYNPARKSLDTSPPLVLKHKEYLENQKIIERGLMRWECVRRNAQFQRLCQADKASLNLGAGIALSPRTTKDEISKELSKIRIKTGKDKSVGFVNRDHEYKYTAYFHFLKDLGHAQFLNNSAVHCKQLHALVYELVDKKVIKDFSQDEVDRFIAEIPKKADFIVDFGYTKQEIMAEFEKQIDMWGRLHETVGQRNSKRALDYTNIKRYLEVYDSKNNKMTFAKLAQKFYPGASAKNLDSAIQQVKREYKRAQELINGGFVYIK